jgi:hypothetical protein
MSYDISFRVKVENVDAYVNVGSCYANTTWNVREMIEQTTGLPWINCDNNGLCVDIIPKIEHGYNELLTNPGKYKQYEASNGWGTVESTKKFFKRILDSWDDFVRRHEELVPVVTFWIT